MTDGGKFSYLRLSTFEFDQSGRQLALGVLSHIPIVVKLLSGDCDFRKMVVWVLPVFPKRQNRKKSMNNQPLPCI